MEARAPWKRVVAAVVLGTLIVGCSAARGGRGERSRSAAAVVGKRWEWLGTQTPSEAIASPIPGQYTLELGAEGKAGVRFDCNRGGGSYQIAEGQLVFGPLMSTRMACPPGSLADRFAQDLGAVRTFYLEGGKLYLEIPGGTTMRFIAAK